ncbi:hypothetical protein BC835DRAFT_682367 [Cytidiella melzeri]|nr:hypothetical protein BC835DRAFT_682367 [Cytidiella melzeri]
MHSLRRAGKAKLTHNRARTGCVGSGPFRSRALAHLRMCKMSKPCTSIGYLIHDTIPSPWPFSVYLHTTSPTQRLWQKLF